KTVSTPTCSNVLFSAGCAASVITARWSRSQPHWLTRRERQKTPGERVSPFRQWSSSARHGAIGVAISNVPEGEGLSPVVSSGNAGGGGKPMIVALARKLLIALWRFVWQGVVPDGVVLRPAQ